MCIYTCRYFIVQETVSSEERATQTWRKLPFSWMWKRSVVVDCKARLHLCAIQRNFVVFQQSMNQEGNFGVHRFSLLPISFFFHLKWYIFFFIILCLYSDYIMTFYLKNDSFKMDVFLQYGPNTRMVSPFALNCCKLFHKVAVKSLWFCLISILYNAVCQMI